MTMRNDIRIQQNMFKVGERVTTTASWTLDDEGAEDTEFYEDYISFGAEGVVVGHVGKRRILVDFPRYEEVVSINRDWLEVMT